MANWCSNTVVFNGTPEAIKQVQQLFTSMAEQEQKENCGQLPEFVVGSCGGYFFDIYEHDTAYFNYQTKWSPNTNTLMKIADHHKVNFILDYEELGCLIYGRASYQRGVLTDIYLSDSDFEQYEYDEPLNKWHFEGKAFECDSEILEILLERKIANAH